MGRTNFQDNTVSLLRNKRLSLEKNHCLSELMLFCNSKHQQSKQQKSFWSLTSLKYFWQHNRRYDRDYQVWKKFTLLNRKYFWIYNREETIPQFYFPSVLGRVYVRSWNPTRSLENSNSSSTRFLMIQHCCHKYYVNCWKLLYK